MRMMLSLLLMVAGLLTGCGSMISEQHYFATYRPEEPAKPTNFFRLSVDGWGYFTNSRYLAGYYDERAVDLFFNEMKAPENQRLFDTKVIQALPADEKFKSLSPTTENGAFLLIMSTNADSVADAIGGFAESQIVAQALTQLVNKDKLKDKARSDVDLAVGESRARVLIAKMDGHLAEASNAKTANEARAAYTRALHALSQALGNREPSFKDFADAKRWFDLELSHAAGTP